MPQLLSILRSLILSGFFFILIVPVTAQQYTFLNYSPQDGLAQSQVTDMVQDQKGYIWFSTFGGVSSFDGLQFRNYTRENGLLENQVYSMHIDNRGNIWLGMAGGYSVYDGKEFRSFRFENLNFPFFVVSITSNANGGVWMALDGGGIVYVDKDHKRYFSEAEGLDPNVRCVLSDKNERVWAATRSGLFLLDQSGKFHRVPVNGFEELNLSWVEQDKSGLLWIATYDQGVFHQEKDGSFTNLTMKDGLIDDWIRKVYIDQNGNAWFAAISGASKYDGNSFQNFTTEQGLVNNNLKFISQDTEGNIWMGTDGKGIMKLAGEAFVTYTSQEGLASDFVMSISEDRNGALWMATYGGGVSKYVDGEISSINNDDGLSNNTVWTTATDKEGNVWFGTSNGLSRWDGKRFTNYWTDNGLLSNKITSLLADDAGLWVGNKDGLSYYNGEEFINYGFKEGIPGGNIRSICKDENGVLWLGSSSGLIRMEKQRFQLFQHDSSNADNTVYSIIEDQNKVLWIGTKSGLFWLDRERNEFHRYPLGEGVGRNNINFLIWGVGTLWAGTNSGIFEIDTDVFLESGLVKFKQYTRQEGVKGLESNMNAAFKDSKGRFWFGTDAGLVKFDPSLRKKNANTVEPKIHIIDVKLFFEDIDWNKFKGGVDTITGFSSNPVFPYNKNHFTFYFVGISYTNPQKVRYRFKLEGVDEDWSPITESRSITYSNLPHGSFTFKVEACNDAGVWTSSPATFSFSITPPFWLTWWFYSLVAVVVFSIMFLIYRTRINSIRRKSERERLIYTSRLLSLEQQSLNASMNRHFIFNALNSIQYYINKQDKLEANRYLTSFAKLIRKNLDSSATGNMVSLAEELERLELYLSLENMRFKNKFSYSIEVDDEVDTESVRIPPMLLQPYVENSIWHGILPMDHPGHITIRISGKGKDSYSITIEDNGIGIDNSLKQKGIGVTDHISRGIEINSGRLNLLKKLTNGELEIKGPFQMLDSSGESLGTRVDLTIPRLELHVGPKNKGNDLD